MAASMETDTEKQIIGEEEMNDDEDISPIEQVRLTVSNEDDPSLPVWTFRMWFLGILSCALLSFLNTFFSYRQEPLSVTMITVQVVSLPAGRFLAKVLPKTKFRLPFCGSREFSLNPGPFNMKEHVLISIFANAGSAPAYAVGIVNIIKAFYKREISFFAGWILVLTTQVLGYGWAGIMRKYVVEPAEMWWPQSLVQVSLFSALHEKDISKRLSRGKFFVIALACSFSWYLFPGYLFKTISTISVLCLVYPKSVTAQQIGSGLNGLGIASFTFDWSVVVSFLGSPLITPFFAIVNVIVGYVAVVYMLIPVIYWVFNMYQAKTFPIYSKDLFDYRGQSYNVSAIVNDKFELDLPAYEMQGRINLSIFFTITYALNFAAVAATITHVAFFNGKEIYQKFRASSNRKPDIHTKLMNKYTDIPSWWFYGMLVLSFLVALLQCIFMKDQIQLPWWGLIFSLGLALAFTLPISIITATTNQTPGLNVITEYVMGLIYPGRPIANVCFKTYGYISMTQAVSFLSDFKLGHYMKIPPRSMFMVQLVGTLLAGTVNIAVAWYLLGSIPNICDQQLLPPGSPFTCPNDHIFFNASVIWGLAGPKRIFGSQGNYSALNWCFLGGALAPVLVWLMHKTFPSQKWIPLINIPILLGATALMPPASTINFNSWIFLGIIFNFFIFRYRKSWWQRYNYVLSAALDAGVAFMGVALYFLLGLQNVNISWWGNDVDIFPDHCPLATCPTAKGIAVDGCPLF